jgi:hypothetical protein
MRQRASKSIDPWAALDALVKQEAEPMGAEWFTVIQFAKRYGYSENGAYGKVRELHRSGKLEKWKGIGLDARRALTKYRLARDTPIDGK